jgi:hypothetical protein
MQNQVLLLGAVASASSFALCGCILAPRANAPGAATETQAKTGEAAPQAAAAGQKVTVWDGDAFGRNAKGWQECNQKPDCKVSLAAEPTAGKTGSGLKFHAEGMDWMGFGWNWFGYWPADAGTDISAAKVMTFNIKVQSQAWDPKALTVGLRCSAGKKESDSVTIAEFVQDLGDGQWHEVTIPLDRFTSGKGAAFDKKTAWELAIGTWSQTPQNLDVYLDDVAFQ